MILALDPGIDDTGWALIRTERSILTYHQASKLLLGSGTLRTITKDDLIGRLASLCGQLETLIQYRPGILVVAIEQPAISGTYKRHAGRDEMIHRRLAPMHLATGALAATAMRLLPGAVEFTSAGGSGKQDRSLVLRSIFPELKQSNQDQRDAVWLGLSVLTDGTRHW
jgi:hypothetical protein